MQDIGIALLSDQNSHFDLSMKYNTLNKRLAVKDQMQAMESS